MNVTVSNPTEGGFITVWPTGEARPLASNVAVAALRAVRARRRCRDRRTAVAVGQEVAMLFGAAQRDPRRFASPDRFDAGRGDPAHIGFGGGIHFCVGAPLARLELDVSVTALAARLPQLHLAVEPEYHPTFVIRGLTALQLAP